MTNRFIEHPDRRELNNQIANRAKVAPADLADGTEGVLIVMGKALTVFTVAQAERLRSELDRFLGDDDARAQSMAAHPAGRGR